MLVADLRAEFGVRAVDLVANPAAGAALERCEVCLDAGGSDER